jgi:hypothetical protein
MKDSGIKLRKLIAKRLSSVLKIRGIDITELSNTTELSNKVIKGYLEGSREMLISELQCICIAISINFYQLLSPDFVTTTLHFRNITTPAKELAQRIENAFHLIRKLLPNTKSNISRRPTLDYTDRSFILAPVPNIVNRIKAEYGETPEQIINFFNLPLISIESEVDFDSFLLCSGGKYLMVINESNPSSRILFSLLHEISHFLFDGPYVLQVDTRMNMFSEQIKPSFVHEFFATKFAQFYLIPFDVSEKWILQWPNVIPIDKIQETIQNNRTSKEVAVNTIFDHLYLRGEKHPSYNLIQDRLGQLTAISDKSVFEFLRKKTFEVFSIINEHKGNFSDDVFQGMIRSLQGELS